MVSIFYMNSSIEKRSPIYVFVHGKLGSRSPNCNFFCQSMFCRRVETGFDRAPLWTLHSSGWHTVLWKRDASTLIARAWKSIQHGRNESNTLIIILAGKQCLDYAWWTSHCAVCDAYTKNENLTEAITAALFSGPKPEQNKWYCKILDFCFALPF